MMGKKITTLDEQERKLDSNDLVIADEEKSSCNCRSNGWIKL